MDVEIENSFNFAPHCEQKYAFAVRTARHDGHDISLVIFIKKLRFHWLRDLDSNQDTRLQRPMSYH